MNEDLALPRYESTKTGSDTISIGDNNGNGETAKTATTKIAVISRDVGLFSQWLAASRGPDAAIFESRSWRTDPVLTVPTLGSDWR